MTLDAAPHLSSRLAPPARPRAAGAGAARPVWRETLAPVLAVFVASRAVVALAALVDSARYGLGFSALSRSWDAAWFEFVARAGYPRGNGLDDFQYHKSPWVFLPGFPMLLRTVHTDTGLSLDVSSLVVNTLLGLGLSALLWFYTAQIWAPAPGQEPLDPGAARHRGTAALTLMLMWPTAVVLSLPYSEALFLVGVTGTLLQIRRGRLPSAGAFTAVAVLSRSTGMVLLVPLAMAAWRRTDLPRSRRWLALAEGVGATAGYLGFSAARSGSAIAFVHAESLWRTPHLSQPWGFLYYLAPHSDALVLHDCVMILISYVALAALAWAGWRYRDRLTAGELAFCVLATLSFIASANGPGLRYLMGLVPLFAVAAEPVRGHLRWAVPAAAAALTVGSWLILMPGFVFP